MVEALGIFAGFEWLSYFLDRDGGDPRAIEARDFLLSADRLRDDGRVDGHRRAENGYRRALGLFRELVLTDAENYLYWQQGIGACHDRIGSVQQAQGNLAAAVSRYSAALLIAEYLAETDPANAHLQNDLAWSRKRLSNAEIQYRARKSSDVVSPRTVQDYPADLGTADIFDLSETYLSEARRLYAEARKRGYTVDSAIEALERQAKGETTGRASPNVDTHPKITGKSSRRRERYVFTKQELSDPDTVDRARDILADAEEFRRTGKEMSEVQRKEKKWAEAFTRRLRKLNALTVA